MSDERELVAQACRVLVARNLADGLLGHVSLRTAAGLLVRCRGPHEQGLAATNAGDIRLVPDETGASGWAPPNELPIHTAVLAAVPAAMSVVHAHPPATVALDLAGHAVVPLVGAYDIPGTQLAAGGVPVYPHAMLIDSDERGTAVAAALGDRAAVVLRGHGLVTWGRTVAEAVLRAVSVDRLATLALAVLAAGGRPTPIPDEDLAQLPDLGTSFTQDAAWRHELARLPAGESGRS